MISHLYLPERCLEVAKELLKRFLVGIENFPAHVPLSNLLVEVDNWTGFLWHFTYLTSGDTSLREQKLVLVVALMGVGMNLGLPKMAESCAYSYRQLYRYVDT